jgi:RNA polymerase sigma-70 factor (ECF subfamily)
VVLAQAEFAEAVRVAVAELPDRLRLPLVLRTHEGWSYDEIAEELGIRPTTARTQVMDARRELERRLRPHLDSEVR